MSDPDRAARLPVPGGAGGTPERAGGRGLDANESGEVHPPPELSIPGRNATITTVHGNSLRLLLLPFVLARGSAAKPARAGRRARARPGSVVHRRSLGGRA